MNLRRLRFGPLALAALLGFQGASPAVEPGATPARTNEPAPTSFEKDVVPFLAKHCYSCHGGGKQSSGDLTLDNTRTPRPS